MENEIFGVNIQDEKLINKYLELNQIDCSGKTFDDKVIEQLTKLYKLLIQCDQFEEFKEDELYKVGYRVVKIRRFIDKYKFNIALNEAKDAGEPDYAFNRVYVSGLWMAIPGIHVSRAGIEKMTVEYSKGYKVINYTRMGFPEDLMNKIKSIPITIGADGTAFIPFSNAITRDFYSGNNFKLFVTETI